MALHKIHDNYIDLREVAAVSVQRSTGSGSGCNCRVVTKGGAQIDIPMSGKDAAEHMVLQIAGAVGVEGELT